MQQDVRALKPRPKPRRQHGLLRIVVHIVLFSLLGALLLWGGIYGRLTLEKRTHDQRETARIDALLEDSISQARTVLLDGQSDPEVARGVNQGFSSRKRLLKEQITSLVREGQPDESIVPVAIDALLDGAIARTGDEAVQQELTVAMQNGHQQLVEGVSQRAAAAVEGMTVAQARLSLPVTTHNYALIYYYAALIAGGAFFLLFALALLFVWLRYDDRKKARVGELLEPMDYLFPFFVGVALFTLYPIVRVVIMSFQERYRLEGTFAGWGLGNYQYVLQGIPGTSNYFLQGLRNTLLYVLYTVPISTALAIVIAYLLNQRLRFSALFQTGYFLPMVTSVTAVGLVWRWIFNRDFGVLNALLGLLGTSKIDWLQQASNSMAVLVIFGIWSALPFTIILLLSGLQNIDESFYTVAKVDGARQMRIFRRITVPLLAPTIGLVLTINSISAFKVFTEVTVLFNGNPGPVLNLYTVVYYIYDMMNEKRELGRAAAAAIILFLFILVFTVLQRYIQRKWKYD